MPFQTRSLIIFFLIIPTFSLNVFANVFINEILANGVDDPDSEWIELYNNESSSVELANWNISETSSSNFTLMFEIPAKGFIILTRNVQKFNETYQKIALKNISIINITVQNFNLADTNGIVSLYDNLGNPVEAVNYAQESGKAFENISVGRYPDGTSNLFNLSTLTPGAKNDNQKPFLNKWINPPRNNTKISGATNISINITDDSTDIDSAIINFNGTNFSMEQSGDLWHFLWNTSNNLAGIYNFTVFFNDSYSKLNSDTIFNITVAKGPIIINFSPSDLTQIITEGFVLNFSVTAISPENLPLNYSWFVDNILSSNNINFSFATSFESNGTHIINATVEDDASNQDSAKWNVVVKNVNRPPNLQFIENKNATKNRILSFNISAHDPDKDTLDFFSNKSEIKISNLNNSFAIVSWKPTNKDFGENLINFSVSDGIDLDSNLVIIDVDAKNNTPPIILSQPKTTATINEKYIYKVEALDADNDTLLFFLNSNLSSISIDSSSGIISFKPNTLGIFSVKVSASDFVDIINQSYNLSVLEGSKLRITDIDVKIDGKTSSNIENNTKISNEAEPSSSIEFKIKVKNDISKSENIRIENIKLKVEIEDIDESDSLEEEANEFDLSAQSEKTSTLKFKLPLNIDEGAFDVLIKAHGNAENGSFYEHNFRILLEVEKKKHDLMFLSTELGPIAIGCNRILNLKYDIINVGEEDEEKATLEIRNDALGLRTTKEDISVNAGTRDNTFSGLINLKMSDNIESGTYPFDVNIYSDDAKLKDTKRFDIKINDCLQSKEAIEGEVVLLLPSEQTSSSEMEQLAVQASRAKFGTKQKDLSFLLLLLSTSIFTIFFLLFVIFLAIRR